MNGTDIIKIPIFLKNESLPAGYYDAPNPYINPPKARYNFRAMVNYAINEGREFTELTKEEADAFLLK